MSLLSLLALFGCTRHSPSSSSSSSSDNVASRMAAAAATPHHILHAWHPATPPTHQHHHTTATDPITQGQPARPLDVLCEAKVSAANPTFIKCTCGACIGGGGATYSGGSFGSVSEFAAHGRDVFGYGTVVVLGDLELAWTVRGSGAVLCCAVFLSWCVPPVRVVRSCCVPQESNACSAAVSAARFGQRWPHVWR